MAFANGHALLIGVGTYTHAAHLDVPVTVGDVEEIAGHLQDPSLCGYDPARVTTLLRENATRANILAALDGLAMTKAGDTVLIFYSGHGELGTDGKFHLTAHDTAFSSTRVETGTGVEERLLLDKLNAIPAQRAFLIFNACRSGSIAPGLLNGEPEHETTQGRNLPSETAAALLNTGKGRVIITACREDQQSYFAREARRTIFGQALANGLRGEGVRNRHGYISLFDLYSFLFDTVKDEVYNRWAYTQEPVLTILQGVGEMAIALYRGNEPVGPLTGALRKDTLGAERQLRVVDPAESAQHYQAIMLGAINIQAETVQGNTIVGGDKIDISGDMALGDVDRRTGVQITGGTVIGPVTGFNKGTINYSFGDTPSAPTGTLLEQVHMQVRQAVTQARKDGHGDLAYELDRIERDLDQAVRAEQSGNASRRASQLDRARRDLQILLAQYPALQPIAQALASL